MAPTPILKLSNCVVRAYHDGDIESLAKEANNPQIARWLRNPFPQPHTMQDAEKWFLIANALSPLVDFAICHVNGSIISEVDLQALEDIHHRAMEIGY